MVEQNGFYLSIETAASVMTLAVPNNVYKSPLSEHSRSPRSHSPPKTDAMMTNGRTKIPRKRSARAKEVMHIPVTVVILRVRYTT